jgi:hypothetical protein
MARKKSHNGRSIVLHKNDGEARLLITGNILAHTHIHTPHAEKDTNLHKFPRLYSYVHRQHIRTYLNTYTHTHTYTQTYTHTHTQTNTHTHTQTHTHTHTHTHTNTNTEISS